MHNSVRSRLGATQVELQWVLWLNSVQTACHWSSSAGTRPSSLPSHIAPHKYLCARGRRRHQRCTDPCQSTSLGHRRLGGAKPLWLPTLARSGMHLSPPDADRRQPGLVRKHRRRRPPSSFETEGYLSILTDNASDVRIETEDLWAPSAFIANTTFHITIAMQTTNLE